LFAVACARHIEHRIRDERFRVAIGVAEADADGIGRPDALAYHYHELRTVWYQIPYSEFNSHHTKAAWAAMDCVNPDAHEAARSASIATSLATSPFDSFTSRTAAALVRDIFGNPFRPVTFSPEWWTDTAVALARQMYESREFSAMPILADALQDAGCDDDDVLSHCRDTSLPHVRGCWVVDRMLGKD
jgi:hypothetical protein